MRLHAPTPLDPPATDVPDALRRAAMNHGHAPAVTHIGPRGREEQGFTSLAQWAAKGAHLLGAELDVEPGDPVGVDIPPGWMLAAVTLACWWAGAVVDVPGADPEISVRHERRPPSARSPAHAFVVGDAPAGGPTTAVDEEAWAMAVQAFPDRPPPARIGERALVIDHEALTQGELLELAASTGLGPAGVDDRTRPRDAVVAVALRPLVVGRPTVVLDGTPREAAAADGVEHWL